MSTDWSKRNKAIALLDGKPRLTIKSAARGPNHIGNPVPKGFRGTEYAPRNPMYDTEAHNQEENRSDPIRTQLVQRGVK